MELLNSILYDTVYHKCICRTGSRNVRYNSIYHHGSGACSCFIYEI